MKKKVHYSFKMKINQHGELVNCHCECPAGKGPAGTCKHVAAVALMLTEFKSSGKLQTTVSCTEQLQTFHQPLRKHTGSPVKAEQLEVSSQRYINLDDPRPVELHNMPGYTDFVRSQVTNYCYSSGKDLAVRYTWEKADINSAMLDHNYLARPFVEYWIDSAIQTTREQANSIEHRTRNQSRSTVWHEERAWRLTSSNFGPITRRTVRRDHSKLCASLLHPPVLTTAPVLHGLQYETTALEKFAALKGVQVTKCGLFVSQKYPFLAATPDGLIGKDAVVEVKCPYTARDSVIKPGKGFPFLYETDGELRVKATHRYYDQVQGQLFLTGRSMCYFVIYTFQDFKVIEIPVEKSYCEKSLVPKLQCFFVKYYKPFLAHQVYC